MHSGRISKHNAISEIINITHTTLHRIVVYFLLKIVYKKSTVIKSN